MTKTTNPERDPTGRDAHAPGAKLDAGKNRLSLVLGSFSGALTEVGKVGTYGANKYSANGWVDVPNGVERYSDAMLRHLMSDFGGEECDQDTGIRHAAHAAWNALAVLELKLRAAAANDNQAKTMPKPEVVLSSALPPDTAFFVRRASDRHDQALGIQGVRFDDADLRRWRGVAHVTDARASMTVGPDPRSLFHFHLGDEGGGIGAFTRFNLPDGSVVR